MDAKHEYKKGDRVIITKHLNMPHLEGTVVTIVGLCFIGNNGNRVYNFRFDADEGGELGWIEETCMKPYE